MADDISRKLGNRIRRLRADAGLSQAALAERAGLAVDAVSRIERGTRSPRLDSLVKLALGLGQPLPVVVDLQGDLGGLVALPPSLAAVVAPLRDAPVEIHKLAEKVTNALADGAELLTPRQKPDHPAP